MNFKDFCSWAIDAIKLRDLLEGSYAPGKLTGSAKKGLNGAALKSHVLHRREYFESKIKSSDWLLYGVCDVNRSRTVRLREKKVKGTFTTEFSA